MPDTGSLCGDVLALLWEINATRTHIATTVFAHLAAHYQATGTRPGALTDPSATGREEAVDTVFERAVARGEVDPARLTERVKTLPFDVLRLELLTTFAPAADATLQEIVDTLFLPLVGLTA